MKNLLWVVTLLTLTSCYGLDFDLCGLGIVKPYYVTGLEYKGGIYAIEKEVSQHYKVVKENSSGIAKIRFKVNCHEEIGDLHYEEYDTNYQLTELNDSIQTQLMTIVGGLTEWVYSSSQNGDAVNSHGFLSFRIEQGSIVQILPK